MKMIDLRSDTVTKPKEEMLNAMMNAEVGDDVYGEDPSINALQEKVAKMFGKESAIFVPSGTMANQIALACLTETGDEIICEKDSHIFYYETAAPSILSRIQLRCLDSTMGEIPIEDIEKAIRPDIYYLPRTSLIALENTHNRHGGQVLSLDYIKSVNEIAKKHNLKMHLDGARIWNAHIYSGVSFADYGSLFDTINVCFSKGLGAPIGSMLIGDSHTITKAKKWRKILGGGMRQAGILAASANYALDNNLGKLNIDHQNAKDFAKGLQGVNQISINLDEVHTNIVKFQIDKLIDANAFLAKCKSSGLLMSNFDNNVIRAVFHLQISQNEMLNAIDIIKENLD